MQGVDHLSVDLVVRQLGLDRGVHHLQVLMGR
jgi:hypothetical protein